MQTEVKDVAESTPGLSDFFGIEWNCTRCEYGSRWHWYRGTHVWDNLCEPRIGRQQFRKPVCGCGAFVFCTSVDLTFFIVHVNIMSYASFGGITYPCSELPLQGG